MALEVFSTHHLDYLQRSGITVGRVTAGTPRTSAPPTLRRFWQINSVGHIMKAPAFHSGDRPTLPSEDVLVGVSGSRIPIAYLIRGTPAGISLYLGTWSSIEHEGASAAQLDTRQEVIRAALDSLYPAIELVSASVQMPKLPLAGLVLGNPTAKPSDSTDGSLPIDRLIRAMAGANWACLILAEPQAENRISALRDKLINELRSIEAATQSSGAPSPLAEHYYQLLQLALTNLTFGQALGAWRTAVYLAGDPLSYYRLAGVWRGIFSGEQSLPEPVRVWDSEDAAQLAVDWAMPDIAGPKGPGFYQHTFLYQSLLSSSQLAAYIHLPRLETSGFAVNTVPDFDAVPPPVIGSVTINLGKVIHRSRPTRTQYRISPRSLARHAFVAGVTGAGKTNTIFQLLHQLAEQDVPFLVIEPAKTEYRRLVHALPPGRRMQVFTLGHEMVAPFRLNPFEVLPGTAVGVHTDLIRSLFVASFGMWTPLPQILEQCIYQVYQDKGWDITTGSNARLGDERQRAMAFPTLSDLVTKIDEVTRRLGYDREITANMRTALITRINSLRTGGKGRMLDVKQSIPMHLLLGQNTVLELEGVGDDNDRAFIMGLILIRLAEYRRAQTTSDDLHVLVIEEAHRLLANVGPRKGEAEADPRGKAVESFTNLLAEIRAYGQGVIIADQVPVKLAADVIKNTNLKIAHRVVALDDRATLAGAMAMNEQQAQALAILRVGQAAVFAEGDDGPLLVEIEEVKACSSNPAPTDEQVANAWRFFSDQEGLSPIYHSYPTCAELCVHPNPTCTALRKVSESPSIEQAVAAFVLSLALSPNQGQAEADLKNLYWHVRRAVLPQLSTPGEDSANMRCLLTHAIYRHLEMRGAQYGWEFEHVSRLAALLLPAATAMASNEAANRSACELLGAFCQEFREHCQRTGPFYGCSRACGETCYYRYALEPYAQRRDLQDAFRDSVAGPGMKGLVGLCDYVIDQILLPLTSGSVRRQAALCFVIQQVDTWRDYGWAQQQALVDQLTTGHSLFPE